MCVRGDQAPVAMWLGAGLSSAEFAPFPRPCAAGGTADCLHLLQGKLLEPHDGLIMRQATPGKWSILYSWEEFLV